ncbi:hypothetical protein Nepgr_010280 [Nepenthes gracilis]|uniref:Uncharacterized protein n=1 Tax=Nepenthes gracilis TaxID=150966 RepID=A0AAD3SCR2_NEPGR|nr:hypothetical protein Nepgr_010280 [Nepenthes gracilis]
MSPLGSAPAEGGFVFSTASGVLVAPAMEILGKAWHTRSHEPGVRTLFQESSREALDLVGVSERESAAEMDTPCFALSHCTPFWGSIVEGMWKHWMPFLGALCSTG